MAATGIKSRWIAYLKMNRCKCFISLSLLFVLPIISPGVSHAGRFKVAIVYSGVSIKAIENGKEINVRMLGIDVPEIRNGKNKPEQSIDNSARKYLSEMIFNKIVDIKFYGLDIHKMVLGVVFINGRNVNVEMIKAGMVRVASGKAPPHYDLALFRKAEKSAREAKRGIWIQENSVIGNTTERKILDEKARPAPPPDTDKARKDAHLKKINVKSIHYEIGKTGEKVIVHLDRYSLPKVFTIEDRKPRIVIDIENVSVWQGKYWIPVGGKLIKRIRTHLHAKSGKLRIVLDLNVTPSKCCSVAKVYDAARHIYWIEIRK